MSQIGESVLFEPFVGPGYRQTARRLLIVGESHYGEPDENPAEATRTVVEKWTSGVWNVRYLMIGARILTGLPRHLVDRAASVRDIAFYNFVQVMMVDRSMRPTWKQVVESCPAFREALLFLDPTHVLVTGNVPWNGVVAAFGQGSSREFGDRSVPQKLLPTPSGHASAIKVGHLSYASADKWMGPVAAFLAEDSPREPRSQVASS